LTIYNHDGLAIQTCRHYHTWSFKELEVIKKYIYCGDRVTYHSATTLIN